MADEGSFESGMSPFSVEIFQQARLGVFKMGFHQVFGPGAVPQLNRPENFFMLTVGEVDAKQLGHFMRYAMV